MVSVSTRKIIEIGNKKTRSKAVTLPIDWIRFNRPNEVTIFYDSIIVITPVHQSKELEDRVREFLQMISYKTWW